MNGKDNRTHSLSRSFMLDYLAASVPSILLLVLIAGIGFRIGTGYFTDMIGTATHELNEFAEQHLRQLGEQLIRNKARDTAKQAEIYLRSHPDISMQELQSDDEFKRIAVQPVGKTGYTVLYEAETGIARIHPNPAIVNQKMSSLAEKRPSWWAAIEPSLTGKEFSGCYDWIESDSSVRQKYMTSTPVNHKLHGITLMISATTYIDEFSAPAADMRAKSDEIRLSSRQFIFRQSLIFGIAGVLTVFLMLASAAWLARRAKFRYIQPIEQLAAGAGALGHGKWDTAITDSVSERKDEIGELATAFRKMAAQLRELFTEQEQRMNELIRAEAALRESETKFKSIYENTYDTIMLLTEKGFFDCNRRTLKMFGFSSKEEFTSVHPSDISPPYQPDAQDSLTAADRHIQTAVEKGYCFFEWMHRRKNGEDFPADVILSSYQLNGEKIVQATVRDISERKAAERLIQRQTGELRESEEKYRSIFDNALEGIFQSTPEGRFIKVNPSLAKIHGTDSPEEMITSVTNIGGQIYVDPESREELGHKLREHGYVQGFETQMYRKDKSVIWVSMNARCVRDSLGNILFYEGFVTDITRRRQTEEALKQHQEHLEDMVEKRTAELTAVLTEARIARETAERANRKITDSINYAKMIQSSLLANLDVVKFYLPNSFFIWEPRDIVGGDIFYTDSFEDGFIVAVIDCTGHGVPGAFMTMIAVSALKRIVKDGGCHDPAEILKRLNIIVKTTLHQDKAYAVSDDGMDAGIVRVIHTNIESPASGFQASELTFAGAKIPLYYVCSGELTVIKGDRQSIGYRRSDVTFCFTNHTLRIEKGMNFYMATDGFADQLGKNRRRFGTARFKNLLKEVSAETFEKQRSILTETFEIHAGRQERQDDMTVVGFGF